MYIYILERLFIVVYSYMIRPVQVGLLRLRLVGIHKTSMENDGSTAAFFRPLPQFHIIKRVGHLHIAHYPANKSDFQLTIRYKANHTCTEIRSAGTERDRSLPM